MADYIDSGAERRELPVTRNIPWFIYVSSDTIYRHVRDFELAIKDFSVVDAGNHERVYRCLKNSCLRVARDSCYRSRDLYVSFSLESVQVVSQSEEARCGSCGQLHCGSTSVIQARSRYRASPHIHKCFRGTRTGYGFHHRRSAKITTSTRSNPVDFYRIGTASRGPSLSKRPWPDGAAAPPLTVSRLTTDPCRARLHSCHTAS